MLNRTKVAKILQEYAKEVNQSQFLYTISEDNKITIYTDRPGILIGKAGHLHQKYETQLNEIVAQDNIIIKDINLNRECCYKEEYKDVDEEHKPTLQYIKFETVARINYVEVNNSLYDSMYDPMGECM